MGDEKIIQLFPSQTGKGAFKMSLHLSQSLIQANISMPIYIGVKRLNLCDVEHKRTSVVVHIEASPNCTWKLCLYTSHSSWDSL